MKFPVAWYWKYMLDIENIRYGLSPLREHILEYTF